MEKDQSVSTLLWAIDLFAGESKLQREAGWAIKALGNRHSFQVQPVYVVVDPTQSQSEILNEKLYRSLRTAGQNKFDEMFHGIKLKSVRPVPSWKRKPVFKDILFPTDFSDGSFEVFQKVIPFAKAMGSRIHIFHKVLQDISPVWGLAFAAVPLFIDTQMEKKEIDLLQRKARKWQKEAQNLGVPATSEIETQGVYSVTEAILRKIKTGPYLVAMASRSGVVETALLGSVTRQLIREAHTPLWIVHPRAEELTLVKLKLEHQIEDANHALSSTMMTVE
jgi:nucleotide-binding universal stress UspA family protein